MSQPIGIVYDSPASKDAFEGQGHKRTAEALAYALELLKDKNGAIGLEGDWGVGKSTVIKLAEQYLDEKRGQNKDCDYYVFTFDLWAHQTDEFRRAFLEEFISWLREKDLLLPFEATEVREKIRGKEKSVVHNRFKEFNWLAITIIAFSPLVPIAYLWLGPLAFRDKEGQLHFSLGAIHPATYISFVILLIPIGIFLGFFLNNLKSSMKHNGWLSFSYKDNENLKKVLSRTISGMSKESDKITTNEYIRDTDPTTIEFNRIFRSLLSVAQSRDGGRNRVVVVLDNIDRLTHSSIPLLWSEIRSLHSTTLSAEEAYKNSTVSVIVPYDKSLVLLALSKKDKDKNGESAFAFMERELDKEGRNDLIHKTFDRVLRVSPPILTDWQGFMVDRFKEAKFPEDVLIAASQYRLFKLLDLYFQINDIHPTPRKIICYVNDIGVLYSQWPTVPLETIALYVLHKSVLEVKPSALLNPMTIDRRYHSIVGEPDLWQTDLAALLYNVNAAQANQVLLDGPILRALMSSDTSELAKLSHLSGFNARLIDVLDMRLNDWAPNSVPQIAQAAINVENTNIDFNIQRFVWDKFYRIMRSINEINFVDKNVLDGFIVIAKNQGDKKLEIATSIISKFSISVTEDVDANYNLGKNWFNAVSAISKKLDLDEIFSKLTLPKNADFTMGAAYGASFNNPGAFKALKRQVSDEDLKKTLFADIDSAPEFFTPAFKEFVGLLGDKKEFSVKCTQQISSRLTSSKLDDKELRALVKGFAEAATLAENSQSRTALVSNGTFLALAHKFYQEKKHESLAIALLNIILQQRGSSLPTVADAHPVYGSLASARTWYQSFISSEIDEDVVANIAHAVSEYGSVSTWAELAVNNPSVPFFKRVFVKIIKDEKFNSLLTKTLITLYPQIKEFVDAESMKLFFEKLSSWAHHFSKHFKGENVLQVPPSLIADFKSVDNSSAVKRELVQLVDEQIKSLGSQEWEAVLEEEKDILALLVARKECEGDYTLSVANFRQPLLGHMFKVFTGDAVVTKHVGNWNRISHALPSATFKKLPSDVLNKLGTLSVTKQGVEHFLTLYPDVGMAIPWEEKPTIAIEKFFSPIIYSEVQTTRQFIRDNMNRMKKCFDKSSAEIKEVMLDSIASITDEGWLSEVRKGLGIKEKVPTPE